MKNNETFSVKMMRIAANCSEMIFTRNASHLFDDDGQCQFSDTLLLNMLQEAFMRGALQCITDTDSFLDLDATIEKLYQ